MNISIFVRQQRKMLKLTQITLALKSGVGLRFIRDLEQGKKTLRLDKVNQVLLFFGYQVGPVKLEDQEPPESW
jgi:y4mF family transcriptional regulator